jgi:hypothetical protein
VLWGAGAAPRSLSCAGSTQERHQGGALAVQLIESAAQRHGIERAQ